MTDKTVDTSGTHCPLPVLKTKQALNEMMSGNVLKLISTDHSSINDITAFCQLSGHQLLHYHAHDEQHIFTIQKV